MAAVCTSFGNRFEGSDAPTLGSIRRDLPQEELRFTPRGDTSSNRSEQLSEPWLQRPLLTHTTRAAELAQPR